MIDQKLVDYTKTSLSEGKSKEDIYKNLLNKGWTLKTIQDSFAAIDQKEDKEDTQKKTIKIIVVAGAILITAGIFSFIASNWQGIGPSLKVTIIVISMIVAYSLGWYFKEKLGLKKTGGALILLGSLIYGGGIFLVAQIYHIRVNWPDGFILWMLGTIIMTFAIDVFWLFCLAIILGFVSLFSHPFVLFRLFSGDYLLLTSSILLLISFVATLVTAIKIRSKMPQESKKLF